MKTFSFVLLLILPSAGFAQFAGSDDFEANFKDTSKWGPDRIRGSGSFTVSEGVLKFASAQANSIDDIEWPWIIGDAPFNANWSVQMDVNVPVIPLQPGSTAVGLGVGVSNSADPSDSFAMSLENIWGETQQELNYYNRQRTNGQTTENSKPSTSTAVAVRVSWDASTRRLSSWYDPDGRASGYQWTRLQEFNAGEAWALSGAETFKIFIRGYAERTVVSASQNVFGDHFRVSDDSRPAVLWPGNGHYYELVSGNITWPGAQAEAEARFFNGLRGHLATIISAEENQFIASTFGVPEGGRFAWIAGREPKDDGIWIWEAGPERGTQFSNGRAATAPHFFANWGGIEPNDFKEGEDFLMLNIGSDFAGIKNGQWADAIAVPNPSDPVLGYIVEYEAEVGPRLHIRLLGSEIEISFTTLTNQRYQLQKLEDLNSNDWINVGPEIAGDGSVKAVTQTLMRASEFYRLRVNP
jgi:hypothetical protein